MPDLSRVHSWVSKDSEGKQQTQGFNMAKGLTTPLLTKGLRRMTRLFEGDILKSIFTEGMGCFELGPMYSRKTNYYSILKCMSDTVQFSRSRESTLRTSDTFTCCVSCEELTHRDR